MTDIFCPECRLHQPTAHTYCARCGASLPVELLGVKGKAARFFAGVRVTEQDSDHGFLRVTHYRGTEQITAADKALRFPSEHVRFSVWLGDRATCVISLPVSEARELVDFLKTELGSPSDPNPMTAELI